MGTDTFNVKEVQVCDLRIHPNAQRDIVAAGMRRLDPLRLNAIGTLHAVLSTVNGVRGLWIIDGQHRVAALLKNGYDKHYVSVAVHTDVESDEDAAALFLKLNNRTPVSPYDRYKMAVTAGEPGAVNVANITLAHGFQVGRNVGVGLLAGTTTLTKVEAWDHGASLDRSLNVIARAWGTHTPPESTIIEGVALFLRKHPDVIDADLAHKLARREGGAVRLAADAAGLRAIRKMSMATCVAELALNTYNAFKRTRRLD